MTPKIPDKKYLLCNFGVPVKINVKEGKFSDANAHMTLMQSKVKERKVKEGNEVFIMQFWTSLSKLTYVREKRKVK